MCYLFLDNKYSNKKKPFLCLFFFRHIIYGNFLLNSCFALFCLYLLWFLYFFVWNKRFHRFIWMYEYIGMFNKLFIPIVDSPIDKRSSNKRFFVITIKHRKSVIFIICDLNPNIHQIQQKITIQFIFLFILATNKAKLYHMSQYFCFAHGISTRCYQILLFDAKSWLTLRVCRLLWLRRWFWLWLFWNYVTTLSSKTKGIPMEKTHFQSNFPSTFVIDFAEFRFSSNLSLFFSNESQILSE